MAQSVFLWKHGDLQEGHAMRFQSASAGLVLLSRGALSGCSTIRGPQTNFERGYAALNAGNLPLAEKHFFSATQEGEPTAWNNLGVVSERLSRRDDAVRAHGLAARYGIPVAQSNLVRLGEPVPAADLATLRAQPQASGDTAADVTGAFIQGLAQSYRPPTPPAVVNPPPAQVPAKPVTCTSQTAGFGQFAKVETVCK